jgi:4-hydroxy-tetrahydrodipicolinate synthase
LYQHHKAIAEAVAIPNILYNVPGRTSVDMSVETTVRLADVDNIVGIKDATGEIPRGEQLLKSCPEDFAIYSGDDATAVELMLRGGKGNISVTANVVPAKLAEMCRLAIQAYSQNDESTKSRALEIDNGLQTLHANMFVESNPIPVKWALARMGLIGESIRLPLTRLSAQFHAPLEKLLREHGVID